MPATIWVIGCGLLLAAGSPPATCTCEPPANAAQASRNSGVVFRGRVERVEVAGEAACRAFWAGVRGQVFDDETTSWRACGSVATLRVTGSWKGTVGKTATVVTDRPGCGLPFRAGDEYLIYGLQEYNRDAFVSSGCQGSRPVADAQADLAALGPPRTP